MSSGAPGRPVVPPEVLDPARIDAVCRTGLLDTPASQAFDGLAQLAATLLAAPLAFVTLVDEKRSFWKACIGVDATDPAQRQNPVEESFCQYVVADRAPLIVEDAAIHPRTRDNPSVASMGVRAWAGFPVIDAAGHALGSFCVVDTSPRTWTDRDVEVLRVLAQAAATQVDLLTALEQERQVRAQLSVLADATALLLEDLEPRRVLAQLAALAVPSLASWCTTWVPESDQLVPVAVVGSNGLAAAWPPVALDGASASAGAYRTGEPQHRRNLTAWLGEHGPREAISEASSRINAGPTYSVPLVAHGRALGVLTLVRRQDEPDFSAAERDLVRELGTRAAAVLSTAQRYQQERRTAEILQRSMLPVLPDLSELELTATYLPAGGETASVGGDWYDALDLGAGRVALVIGDVMGRGMAAAAVMGQLRSALRALAVLDLSPAHLLDQLDRIVAELPGEAIVTCFYAVFDPAADVLVWSSAGHLLPLVRHAAGTAPLVGAVGAPLGAGGAEYEDCRSPFLPGEVLCLFTDGLVEDRSRDIDLGIEQVRGLLAGSGENLTATATALVAGAAGDQEDDVALLLARVPANREVRPDDVRSHELAVPGSYEAVGQARRWAREVLRDWPGEAELAADAAVVISELVTNGVVHGRPSVRLRLRHVGATLYVEVFDHGEFSPSRRRASASDEGGRGLALVDALSHRWGSRASGGGKVVWAELRP